jgi:cell division protease FtsH
MTRPELENKLAVLLGGRASERLVFDEISTGAADDLTKATDIARSMVTRYGMDEELGHATYEVERPSFIGVPQVADSTRLSEATAQRIDESVREIIKNAFERATSVLAENRATLDLGAQQLLERETLDESELALLFDRVSSASAESPS